LATEAGEEYNSVRRAGAKTVWPPDVSDADFVLFLC
jgi:hypothetical protein